MSLSRIARCVLTDSTALVMIVIIGLVGAAVYNVPHALSFIQVLAVELLALAYPISTLARDKATHKQRSAPDHHLILEIVGFGILAAIIAYLNYLFLFVRHDVSPVYIDTTHPFYLQAMSLTYLTVILCQGMNLLFVRGDHRKKFWSEHLLDNENLQRALLVSFLGIIFIIYTPWLQSLFGTASLGLVDWLTAIAAAALYTGLRLVQRHTRQHTRHAVVKLHHEVHRKHRVVH